MSRQLISQTYFEWYEFYVNIVRILIATSAYESTLLWVGINESEYLVKFQYDWLTYIQNFMSAYELRKNDSFLITVLH